MDRKVVNDELRGTYRKRMAHPMMRSLVMRNASAKKSVGGQMVALTYVVMPWLPPTRPTATNELAMSSSEDWRLTLQV